MKSTKRTAGDNALASQYNALRSDAQGSGQLSPHEQAVPDLTIYVETGVFFIGGNEILFAGGNSPSFTAPTTNPRIDLLVINSSGVLARVAGTEAASPAAPANPVDKVTICQVYNRVGQTKIYDFENAVGGEGYIYRDMRPLLRDRHSFGGYSSFSETNSTGTVSSVTHTTTIPTAQKNCKFIRVQCRVTVIDNNQVFNAGANLFGYFDLNMNETNTKLAYDIATQTFYMYKLSDTTWYQFAALLKLVDGTLTLIVAGPPVSTGTHYYDIGGNVTYYD